MAGVANVVGRGRKTEVKEGNGEQELSQQLDQVVVAQAKSCPHCGVKVDLAVQYLSGIYERIEITPNLPLTLHWLTLGICVSLTSKQIYEALVPT